ncbi:hypothetical protein Q0590_15380 [Rhodocytophaga aerolata]|uniref:DUF4097 domain-containing protein n=1 Tax=Rhodocytophaga aerolata TaxID=455078 RepID=A0ABT8R6C6_9BACT|nr:hypothetical protein [Rhodocytophaga aerolata]MDO1447651.1 hypothetical protein [Rhodocytophaga aerolata]
MYKLLLLAFALLASPGQLLLAQKVVEKTFPLANDGKVHMNLKFGNTILVKAWDKNEVSFKATIDINNGKLNDALVLTFDATNQEVRALAEYDKELVKTGKREDCPEEKYSSWNHYRDGSSSYLCSTITYELTVPRNAVLSIESINANIELKDVAGPVVAKTINGFVDMNWPQNKSSDISMKTINGELYSDLDIEFLNKKNKNPQVGYLLKGTVKGGGTAIHLESINSDIYLRKAN